jgi:hypothetical protein
MARGSRRRNLPRLFGRIWSYRTGASVRSRRHRGYHNRVVRECALSLALAVAVQCGALHILASSPAIAAASQPLSVPKALLTCRMPSHRRNQVRVRGFFHYWPERGPGHTSLAVADAELFPQAHPPYPPPPGIQLIWFWANHGGLHISLVHILATRGRSVLNLSWVTVQGQLVCGGHPPYLLATSWSR